MTLVRLILCVGLMFLGCDDGSEDSSSDVSVGLGDASTGSRDAYLVDAARLDLAIGQQSDFGRLPDAAVQECLASGVPLTLTQALDPMPTADTLYAHVDFDSDGAWEIVVRETFFDRHVFNVYGGVPLEKIGTFAIDGGTDPNLMMRRGSKRRSMEVIPAIGQSLFYVTDYGEGSTQLHFFDSATFAEAGVFSVAEAADDAFVQRSPNRPIIAVNLSSGGCVVGQLDRAEVLFSQGLCSLSPGWDVNGDGYPELVRVGEGGMALFDPIFIGNVAELPNQDSIAIGLTDSGPVDIRGEGDEIVSVELNGRELKIYYHDPVELTLRGEPVIKRTTSGQYQRAEFVAIGDRIKLIAEYDRQGAGIHVQIFDLAEAVREIADLGPFPFLSWNIDEDVDGDGLPELRVVGGSRADQFNTDIDYRSLRSGSTVIEVSAIRSTLIETIWSVGDPPSTADLDGCEHPERVTIHRRIRGDDGLQSTKVVFYDEENVRTIQSEQYAGLVHQAVVTQLDGTGPMELVELRSNEDGEGQLRLYGPPSSD